MYGSAWGPMALRSKSEVFCLIIDPLIFKSELSITGALPDSADEIALKLKISIAFKSISNSAI
mgnify:CR=1 FL=1